MDLRDLERQWIEMSLKPILRVGFSRKTWS